MKKIIVLSLVFTGIALSQWIASIQDSTRATNGVERTDSTVTVYCGGTQRTFNFVSWPPFTVSGENIMSTKQINSMLFSVLLGYDGTNVTVEASIGDSAATLTSCLAQTIVN